MVPSSVPPPLYPVIQHLSTEASPEAEEMGTHPRLTSASELEGLERRLTPPEWLINLVLAWPLQLAAGWSQAQGRWTAGLNGNGDAGDDMNNLNYGLNLHRAWWICNNSKPGQVSVSPLLLISNKISPFVGLWLAFSERLPGPSFPLLAMLFAVPFTAL